MQQQQQNGDTHATYSFARRPFGDKFGSRRRFRPLAATVMHWPRLASASSPSARVISSRLKSAQWGCGVRRWISNADSSTAMEAGAALSHKNQSEAADHADAILARHLSGVIKGMTGRSEEKINGAQSTAHEKINRALHKHMLSSATSAPFRPSARRTAADESEHKDAASTADADIPRDSMGTRRWVNASAPSPRRTSPRSEFGLVPPSGRPISPHRRHALTDRLANRPGVGSAESEGESRRVDWDRLHADSLALAAERETEADPLDAILAPFMPPAPQLDPVDALRDALRSVPSTAGTGLGATHTIDRPTACVGDWGRAASE